MIAVLFVTFAVGPAVTASDYLAFSNAVSEARAAAHELMTKESGQAIDPASVEVSVIDLNSDGVDEIFAYVFAPHFCGKFGCHPRVFQKGSEGYRNIFRDDTGVAQGSPRNIVLVPPGHGGYVDILLGSVLFIWDGQNYVEDSGPTPTHLDSTGFMAACKVSESVAADIRADGSEPEKTQETFCACMIDQFETAGRKQRELDLYGKVVGQLAETDIEPYGEGSKDFSKVVEGFELGCLIDINVD